MLRSTRSLRTATAAAVGLALVAVPAITSAASTAGAAPLKQATASSYQRVTKTATRAAVATMKATVEAHVPGSTAAPISITVSASATRQATSAASAAVRRSATAHGTTKAKAKSRARVLARRAARKIATARATTRAATAAQRNAQTAAAAAARAAAIAKATADAKKRATDAAPGSTPTVGTPVVTPVASPCGGVLPTKATGGRYTTCSFDDNFDGSSLDTSKWYAMDAQKDGFAIGDECFKPENVSQSGGSLALTATKAAQTMNCSGSQKSYQSGLVMTKDKFSQAYGRFEVRAKFPTTPGYVSGFWMLPQNPLAGGWSDYKYGEIDVVENWALHPELAWAHLHYAETPGNYMGGTACNVSPDGNYHTYAVDWSPKQMSFVYDGNTCWTTTWKPVYPYAPAGSSAPAPFDQPFYMILNLSVGGSGSDAAHPLSKTPMGESLKVDWVRAWK